MSIAVIVLDIVGVLPIEEVAAIRAVNAAP